MILQWHKDHRIPPPVGEAQILIVVFEDPLTGSLIRSLKFAFQPFRHRQERRAQMHGLQEGTRAQLARNHGQPLDNQERRHPD